MAPKNLKFLATPVNTGTPQGQTLLLPADIVSSPHQDPGGIHTHIGDPVPLGNQGTPSMVPPDDPTVSLSMLQAILTALSKNVPLVPAPIIIAKLLIIPATA